VIAGPADLSSTEDRARGFRETWERLGGSWADDRLWRGDLRLGSGREVMEQILGSDLTDGRADAVFVTNNRMSAGAFEALRSRDEAPALLATDDDVWTRLVSPSVSVVQQPIRATGRAAARMLGQRIKDPQEPPSTVLLRSQIIERESTAPVAMGGEAATQGLQVAAG
jgi:DNA-binding LacI/PurR family transcriptional regulator